MSPAEEIWVLDADTHRLIGRHALPDSLKGKLLNIAVSQDADPQVYASDGAGNTYVLDARTLRKEAQHGQFRRRHSLHGSALMGAVLHELLAAACGRGADLRRAGLPAGGDAEGAALAHPAGRDRQLPVVAARGWWRRRRRCCRRGNGLGDSAAVGAVASPGLALVAMALLALFAAAMAINIRRGRDHIDCGCGQSFLRQTLSWMLVARNGRAGGAAACRRWRRAGL